jgi:membrane associated rhomboid family serine protease
MNQPNEPPLAADETPLPRPVAVPERPPTAVTARMLLTAIASANEAVWFPSQYAATTGIERDAIDEPLNQLRIAGLIQIATWVRGVGQGYVLTPLGRETAGCPQASVPVPRTDISGVPLVSPEELVRPLAAVSDYRPPSPLGIDSRPSRVVPILLIANVVWFVVGLVLAVRDGVSTWVYLKGGNVELLHRLGGIRGLDLLQGEWWRLMSSCFVHAGGLHLVVNLLALGMIGPLAELLWGRTRLVVIYLLSGLGGSCLAMALQPEVVLIGASGAIWGVLTSLMMWFVLFRQFLPREVAADSIRRLLIVIGLNALLSFLPGVSWAGHLGGGVVGLATAGWLNMVRFGTRSRRRWGWVMLLSLPLLCIGGLFFAMHRSTVWVQLKEHVAAEQDRRARLEQAQDAARALNELRQKIVAAVLDYQQHVVPLLTQLRPEVVEPIEKQAVLLVMRSGSQRNAQRVAEVREQLTRLKADADAAIDRLATPPTGVDELDQLRTRGKQFAEARARSLELLLEMLASDAIPDQAAWDAWGQARRTATSLWTGIRN